MNRRNTIQMTLVLEAVRQLKCHATADEIYQAVAQEYPHISKGTVYRNLQRLCENGEIRKVEVPDGATRFDHILSEHYHVRCETCGRVFDVDMGYLHDLERSVKDKNGFLLTGHSIMFRGICPVCRQEQKGGDE